MTTAPVVPRFLERTVDFTPIRSQETKDGLTFDGYAAVFGSVTRIDSWEGRFNEQIAKGAFRKTIKERTPVLQFDHGRNSRYGSIPIGSIRKLNEDDKGLHVDARMHADPFFGPLREAMGPDSGAINGMSFRFEVVKEDWHYKGKRITDPDEVMRLIYGRYDDDDELVLRTLKELKVPELGPVVFPAYPDTTASVRFFDMARAIATDEDVERQVRSSIARAMNMRRDLEPAPVSENEPEPVSITTDETTEPVQPVVESDEAPVEDESPETHSEDTGESPAGHSEPDSETPEEGRAQTQPVSAATNLDSLERQLARMRVAERVAKRRAQANANVEKYSHG